MAARVPAIRKTAVPPGPRGRLAANVIRFRRDPLELFTSVAHEYGDVAHLRLGSEHLYLVSHPDLVREVLLTQGQSFMKGRALQEAKRLLGEGLLTSEGELHRRRRRLIQPLFHHERIAAYGAIMAEYAARACERWEEGQTVDMAREMQRLTLAVVAKTLFDADVESEAEDVREALTSVLEMFDRFLLPFAGLLERLPLPATRRFHRARDRLDAIIFRMLEERRDGGGGDDLLSLLLLARDEEGGGAGMSDVQIRDEAMTLFLAGHETTALALTWTWYLLAQNPEVEARLHAELDALPEEHLPGAEDLRRLEYARMTLAESMRLYPPAWAIGRRALEDVAIGEYVIPTGSLVVVSQYVTHRDPRWFPEPERFDPERFTPEAEAARPRYAYFPFGAGSRLCIGERFAWMEGVLVLATIARRWRARLDPAQRVELSPLVTLRPKHGMRVVLERRPAPE